MKIEETSHAASDKAFFEHEDTKSQSRYRKGKISQSKYGRRQISRSKYREAIIAQQISP